MNDMKTPETDALAASNPQSTTIIWGLARTLETQRDEARTEAERLRKREEYATHILSNIVNSLPSRRDWLDPVVERMAKDFL